ncbi:MAG: hypothetical protein INR71_06895, partial [Terriglobus roseus]|nr:hypothetical protein [Terriglobus roseus]
AERDSRKSKISISTFAVDSAVGEASEKFEEALQKGDLVSLCESKISDAKTDEEKADWTVIETLMSAQPRKKLMEYLGFADTDAAEKGATSDEAQTNGTATKDGAAFFEENDAGDNFLSTLASSKGAKTNNPFQIFTGSESEADQSITRHLMLGQFEKAVDICLKEDRLSDAFMIAVCGGQKCIDKAQAAYFKQKSGGPNYLRLLASVVGKNLWDFVYNADLKNWKEVMATLCTFADGSDFPDLCEALGDRLEELVQEGVEKGTLRKDATFCYLAGSKLEKVVGNWAQELQESEHADVKAEEGDSSFSIHARSLQNFIEKVTVFRQATKFADSEQQLASGWKLAPLYAKYTEYADVAASHGQLSIAEKYLDLLPVQYPAAEVARNRVKQATRKAAPAAQRHPAATTGGAQRGQRVVPAYGAASIPSATPAAAASPYAPLGATPSSQPTPPHYAPMGAAAPGQPNPSPYAPAGMGASAYQPAGYQPPSVPSIPQAGQFGVGFQQPQQAQGLPPPPRGFTASPSAPPPSSKPLTAWNDTPDFGSKPTSRRGTPAVGGNAITSPFPNAQPSAIPGPPMAAPFAPAQRSTPPLGPPPRGPPRVTSPPVASSPLGADGNNLSAPPNPYAPQPTAQPTQGQPPIPRGTSPYQPPPSSGPSSNRYAPAPGTQPTPQPGLPPPQRQVAPPPNPYASHAFSPAPAQPAQQPTPLQPPPRGPPPGGPPRGPPHAGAHAGAQAMPTPEPEHRSAQPSGAAKPQPKYRTFETLSSDIPKCTDKLCAAPGDRSHIPPAAQSMYEVLNTEMQRVKGLAPASFKPQVDDTEKRLNLLFDALNEGDVLRPGTVQELGELADNVMGRDWEGATQVLTRIMQ